VRSAATGHDRRTKRQFTDENARVWRLLSYCRRRPPRPSDYPSRRFPPQRRFGAFSRRQVFPVPQRPTSWQTFLKAHWGVIAAADFFTTEGWTWRGLVTYYTVFVMDLASRRVHMLGSKRHPGDLFMGQIVRLATAADDGVLMGHRVLICDRDRKRSRAVRQRFGAAGIRAVLTPARAPNANAYAERFVRSIKEECLDRMIPLGERHFRRTHPLGPNLGHYGTGATFFFTLPRA
jgi:transposase InsO family protein